MPVVGIVAAGAGWLGASGAVAAIGTAAFGIADAFIIAGAVGATVSAIGGVTGNKDLQKIGMVLGVVGGIGALAGSVGMLGSSATFGLSAADAAAQAANAAAAGGSIVDEAGNVLNAAASSGIDAAAAGSAQNIIADGGGMMNAGDIVGASVPAPASVQVSSLPVPTQMPEGLASAIEPGQLQAAQGGLLDPVAPPSPNVVSGAGTGPAAGAPAGGIWDKLMGKVDAFSQWSDKHQTASYAMMQAGGSFLSNMFSDLTPAQIQALDAQAAANRAAAALSTTQAANLNEPVPVAQVTGKVQGAGLINSPVTGRVTP